MIKVMVFGSYDGLHPGHLDFFKQAKELGDYLIVSVGTDLNVEKFKGRKPLFTQDERLELISNLKIVDEAVMGAANDFYLEIQIHGPSFICLGYDQWAKEEEVLAELSKVGLSDTKVVRMNAYQKDRAKSTIAKSKSVDF